MMGAIQKPKFLLAVGGSIGLALGLAFAAGIYLGRPAAQPWDELRLRAAAAHGASSFSIASGPVDEEVEGLYCLDFVTGDLTCYVLNPRTGKAGGLFKTNVTNDLPPEKGKAPAYSMVTGTISIRGVTTNARPSASVVYVADANTGYVAGYSFEWNRAAMAAGAQQAQAMKRVLYEKARAELRE